MRKTKVTESLGKKHMLAVTAETLAESLGCGRATAVKVGVDAGARIKIGRRTLYKLSIVDEYLEKIAGE